VDIRALAAEHRVDAFVEGSLRRDGARYLPTAQLIETREVDHLWAETFDRPAKPPLDFEQQVAGEMASALEERVAGRAPWRQTAIAFERGAGAASEGARSPAAGSAPEFLAERGSMGDPDGAGFRRGLGRRWLKRRSAAGWTARTSGRWWSGPGPPRSGRSAPIQRWPRRT
jgi:hypothetical protein